ncbi:putative isoaspartyl peptidase/L-asparaginase [Lachnellula hyalina]|uniref:Putative isoaspartyl peptidase/L-asparaginase n=1 Tax=Lachnellula hyalina TaxID=1316788 RepID=A0A8H8QUZ3_9HELO|nr:putative isoaspartyl peptidase/L-asparaginase [Lachnellula hyalina]TVY23312.1 putative isoaspartyl peptidase/L-asparaginase [Lachnellula hyalina]
MEYKMQSSSGITPRIIIHGGAGNILPSNLPPEKYKLYHDSLLKILATTHHFMTSPSSFPLTTASSTSALDTVTFAVTQLENNPLFNSGHGAVFTRDGVNELEASVMVSRESKKRGVGLMGLQHVKNPIKLAREMLLHGEQDLEGGNGEHRGPMAEDLSLSRSLGAQGHCQLHKYSAEKLAEQWGLEMVDPSYFFVQARWDEHVKGIEKEKIGGVATWDEKHFFPQGTCGAVALDSEGVVAVATSTGGMTNKMTGRIGDTPTLGAGFWAEEWEDEYPSKTETLLRQSKPGMILSEALKGLMADCLPNPMAYSPIPAADLDPAFLAKGDKVFRAGAMSGTGNGDSFLRINAVRTASAIARYRGSKGNEKTSLQDAVTEVTGPGGELVKSAGNRWRKTGEGEGGIIGIEITVVVDANGEKKSAVSHIVDDFNCGGMFRAAVDKHGKAVMRVWKPKQHEGLEAYEGEGREYDLRDWLEEKM